MEQSLLTRRKFFRRFLIGASAVAAIGAADGLFLEPRNLVAEHVNVRLSRLPEAFHGFRIAQISDVHFGPYMGKADLERAVQLAQSFRPDLLALTGDFVSHPFFGGNGPRGARHAEPCAEVCRKSPASPFWRCWEITIIGTAPGSSKARSSIVELKCCAMMPSHWSGTVNEFGSLESTMPWCGPRI